MASNRVDAPQITAVYQPDLERCCRALLILLTQPPPENTTAAGGDPAAADTTSNVDGLDSPAETSHAESYQVSGHTLKP